MSERPAHPNGGENAQRRHRVTPMAAVAFALLAIHVPVALADAAVLAVSDRGSERVAVRQLSQALREAVRTFVEDAEVEGPGLGSPPSWSEPSRAAVSVRPPLAGMRERLARTLVLDLPPPTC